MSDFFAGAALGNELYTEIKLGTNNWDRKARRLTNRMWACCASFVDENAQHRARNDDFYAVWWELYLAYALSSAGIEFVPTKERPRRNKGGPDLLTRSPQVWIEAVMAKPGEGPDALTEPPMDGRVHSVPVEEYMLRLRAAFHEKVRKFEKYLTKGTIPDGEPTVIAISAARLPSRFQEYPIPRIVRALYAIGSLQVQINLETMEYSGTTAEYRNHVVKKSKAEVKTDVFLREEAAHISAVLYSACDCWNYSREPGTDFILIHNPNAKVPLPDSWLRIGYQYRIDGDQLRRFSSVQWRETTSV